MSVAAAISLDNKENAMPSNFASPLRSPSKSKLAQQKKSPFYEETERQIDEKLALIEQSMLEKSSAPAVVFSDEEELKSSPHLKKTVSSGTYELLKEISEFTAEVRTDEMKPNDKQQRASTPLAGILKSKPSTKRKKKISFASQNDSPSKRKIYEALPDSATEQEIIQQEEAPVEKAPTVNIHAQEMADLKLEVIALKRELKNAKKQHDTDAKSLSHQKKQMKQRVEDLEDQLVKSRQEAALLKEQHTHYVQQIKEQKADAFLVQQELVELYSRLKSSTVQKVNAQRKIEQKMTRCKYWNTVTQESNHMIDDVISDAERLVSSLPAKSAEDAKSLFKTFAEVLIDCSKKHQTVNDISDHYVTFMQQKEQALYQHVLQKHAQNSKLKKRK